MHEADRPATFEVGFDLGPTHARVRLRGEVDLAVHRELVDELAAAALLGRPVLVVDLDAVSFLSMSSARLLLTADSHMKARGGRLAIVCRLPQVRRYLQLAGLDGRLAVFPTLRAALGAATTATGHEVAARDWMVRAGIADRRRSA